MGEPPCISATPAIVAAIRDATGRDAHTRAGAPSGHRASRLGSTNEPWHDEREILTWPDFGEASRDLAQMVDDDGFEPDMILAIARGGLLIGGALGYALSVKNLYTMNVEYYTGVDERLEVPDDPAADPRPRRPRRGPASSIADDVADTGHTLAS